VRPQSRFEELYRAHAGNVLAYALRRTTAAAADDVVAEVFLVAWRRLDDVPDDRLPWLLGVARRVLANRRRGEGRTAALRERIAFDLRASDDPRAEVDGRVIQALARLRERDRELLMLIAWDGLTNAEAAQILGVRKGTVAVRLHRARQQFAEALAAEDANESMTMEVRR
jgi:RNA polymerase sigma-70 factor (ECF subfamily)